MLRAGASIAVISLIAVTAVGQLTGLAQESSSSSGMPVFEVDTTWPPELPNNWVMGAVSSVSVDSQDHVWVLHRPRSVDESLTDRAAPPVLEFDVDNRVLNAWGPVDGQSDEYDWPDQPHGISVDHSNNVWITGAAYNSTPPIRSDDMLLKFTAEGELLMQLGGRTQSKGNTDTKNLNRSADVAVYPETNEAFVADGYGNRRVIVFDADTGAFKRMWGAFGNTPEDGPVGLLSRGGPRLPEGPLDTEGPGEPQFTNPVHGIKVSNDGLVYVAGRVDRRIQVFTHEGEYVTQGFVNRAGPARQSAAGLAFSSDPDQRFLYVADFGNSRLVVLDRKTLEVLYQFGTRSETPGNFQSFHHLAADSKGNLYTAEVNPGKRAQKFLFKGMSETLPPNALTPPQ